MGRVSCTNCSPSEQPTEARTDASEAHTGQTKIWSQNGKLLPRRDFYLIRIVGNVIRFYFASSSSSSFICFFAPSLETLHISMVVVPSCIDCDGPWTSDAHNVHCGHAQHINVSTHARQHSHLCQSSNNNNYHIKNQFINVSANGTATAVEREAMCAAAAALRYHGVRRNQQPRLDIERW